MRTLRNTKVSVVILILIFLFTFSFEVKLLTTFGLFFLFFKNVHMVRRLHVFYALFIIFAFAFIYSPYWHALVTHNFLKYVSLLMLFMFGLWWAYYSSGNMQLSRIKIEFTHLGILFLMLYVVNYKFLMADIAYRGDEDVHIYNILELGNYFNFLWTNRNIYLLYNPLSWVFCLMVLFLTSYVLFIHRLIDVRFKKTFRFAIVGIALLLIPLSAALLFPENIFRDHKNTEIYGLLIAILRYPFFQKWMDILFVMPNFYGDIRNFRAVPFLSVLLMAIFLFNAFDQKLKSKLLSLFFSFAFLTVPLILFYSNILYLEMPLIAIMTAVIFNLEILITVRWKKLLAHPLWYLLLLAGFLKETAFIFLVLIILLRLIYLIKQKTTMYEIILEARFYVLLIIPVATYLLFREFSLKFRPYGFDFRTFIHLSNYFNLTKALFFQTGILFPLSLVSFIYMFFLKNRLRLIGIVSILLGIITFFWADGTLYIDAGYSRWNLFLLPMMFYAVFFVIVSVRRYVQLILLFLLLLSNIVLFPFHWDGTRIQNWGSLYKDVAEYTYPYEKAIQFLHKEDRTKSLVLAGQYYPYRGLTFYFEKSKFHPKTIEYPFGTTRFDGPKEYYLLDSFFEKLEKKQIASNILLADAILYHSVNNINLDEKRVYGGRYKIIKRVRNSLHSIYIFQKVRNS